jgi:hypothetical protein
MPPRAAEVERNRRPPRLDPIPLAIVDILRDGEEKLKEPRDGPILELGRALKANAPPPAIRYGMKPANPPAYGIREPAPSRGMASVAAAP